MKRLTAIAVLTLGLLAATLARAEWRPAGGLAGGPIDSWIADAGGYFAVHTLNAAYRLVDNGTSITMAGSLVVVGPKCVAIGPNGSLRVLTQSAISYEETPPGNTTLSVNPAACRATDNLAGIGFGALRSGTMNDTVMFTDAGVFGQEWITAGPTVINPGIAPALSARSVFGREYGLVPRANIPGTYYLVDGVRSPNFTQLTPSVVRSEIFGTRDGGVRAVVVGGDAGQLLALQPGGIVAEGAFSLPPSVTAVFSLRGVTLSELEGDPFGAGFGMLLVDSPDPQVKGVWSAIPDPDNVGRFWVRSSVQPPNPNDGLYDTVRCVDAKFCVLGSNGSTSGNQLATYRNANAPSIITPAFVLREEETMMQTLTVDAGDDDGDAVFVTVKPDSGVSAYFASIGRAAGSLDGTTWFALPINNNPALCGLDHVDIPLAVMASDGLNKSQANGTVTVIHQRAGQPGPNQTTLVPAGTGQAVQTLAYTLNGCSLDKSVVTVPAGTPATVTLVPPDLVTVAYTPPRTWCDDTPDSGAKEIQVRIVDGPLMSPPGISTFIVLPWGEPEPPFGGGAVVSQDAGTSVTYAPAATHLCGDAGTFPGVDTHWSWFATGAGFTPEVLQSDGGRLPMGGAFSPTATVVALDACQSGTVTFQTTNTTRMTGGLTSPDSGLTVNVTTTLETLTGTLLLTAIPGPGSVSGTLDLTGVQCQSLRTISGLVELYRTSDGGFISSMPVSPVPGSYSLPAPGACGGGTFTVRATASDQTGGMLGPVTQNVDLPLLDAGFDQVQVSDFQITCGNVASADASVTFLLTQCSTAQVDWTSSGAVAIVPTSGSPSVLATVSSDFGGLIGMPVTVTATATAETGVASQDAPTVLVRTEPFVSVVHRTDTTVASESRVMGVEVQLTNTTACPVSGVEWHASLTGMRWIEGSVTGADGGTMDAGLVGGELVVPGLSLPAGQPVTFRYSARPTLFGDPTPGGVATLRTVQISVPSGLDPGDDTCGCQSGSSGATALAGLLAAALLRARRRRAPVFLRARS